jgi:Transglutaminase-like superfamily
MTSKIRLASAVAALVGGLLAVTFAADPTEPRKMRDERLYALARSDFKAFAHEVSKGATSELGQTQAIVRWLTQNFEWKTTDYQKRTVPEIVERGGGNCDDFSSVALAAMTELKIKSRKVHEVHIRTESPERGERARALVKDKGNTYSVFGRHHNDHVYLEVYDSSAREWFPADPWGGLVGTDEWMKGRVWFGRRHSLNPDAEDMIVPIAIFAADADGKFTIDRTKHYLIDELGRLYAVHKNPVWPRWVALLEAISPKVKGAFAGTFDLHQAESEIDELAATYDRLRADASNE